MLFRQRLTGRNTIYEVRREVNVPAGGVLLQRVASAIGPFRPRTSGSVTTIFTYKINTLALQPLSHLL